jgi:hypothetical protein
MLKPAARSAYAANRGIRVVGVNPGPVDTDRIYNMLKKRSKDWFGTEERYKELQERYPLKRPAHLHEVTSLIVFRRPPPARSGAARAVGVFRNGSHVTYRLDVASWPLVCDALAPPTQRWPDPQTLERKLAIPSVSANGDVTPRPPQAIDVVEHLVHLV